MWQSILTLMSHFHPVSPTPPYPAPRALCNRTIPGETQLKKYWAKSHCLWMNFLLENGANTQKTKRRTFGITMVSILQVRRFLIQAEVLVRGLRTRCLYGVWKYLPSLSSLLELVSKRPKNVKLCQGFSVKGHSIIDTWKQVLLHELRSVYGLCWQRWRTNMSSRRRQHGRSIRALDLQFADPEFKLVSIR